jgi:hypothetical protein
MIYIDPNDEPPTGFIKGSLKNNQSRWFNTITQKSEYFNNDVIPDANIYIKGSPNSATWRLQNIKTGELIYSKTKHVEGYEHKPFGKDKVWVNKDNKSTLIDKSFVDHYLNELGYSKGRLPKMWVTNGITDKGIYPDELAKYESLGFRKGRSNGKRK